MDGISGSAPSIIELGMAMNQVRTQNAMSISAVKKGMNAQAQLAMSLIDTVQQVQPERQVQQGQQVLTVKTVLMVLVEVEVHLPLLRSQTGQ